MFHCFWWLSCCFIVDGSDSFKVILTTCSTGSGPWWNSLWSFPECKSATNFCSFPGVLWQRANSEITCADTCHRQHINHNLCGIDSTLFIMMRIGEHKVMKSPPPPKTKLCFWNTYARSLQYKTIGQLSKNYFEPWTTNEVHCIKLHWFPKTLTWYLQTWRIDTCVWSCQWQLLEDPKIH